MGACVDKRVTASSLPAWGLKNYVQSSAPCARGAAPPKGWRLICTPWPLVYPSLGPSERWQFLFINQSARVAGPLLLQPHPIQKTVG